MDDGLTEPPKQRRQASSSTGNDGRYEELYMMLLDAIPSSVLLIDRQLRILSANRNFLDKSQRQASNTLGQPIDAVFPPLILEHMHLARRILAVFERNESVRGERMTYRAPGLALRVYYYSLIPFSWQGTVEHVMLLMEDVTEQQRLGEEARRAERHLASVVESASDVVLSATVGGRILTWNAAAETISGFTLSEVQNCSLYELCAAPHQASVRRGLKRVTSGKGFGVAEWDLVTKSGALAPVSWVGSVMKDDLGNVTAVVAVGRDLSERRKLEAQLLQSQKLAALGVLAGGIAHEIRNPLAATSSAAQFLQEGSEDPAFREDCLRKILEGIRRASVIIEDLLRFARPGTEVAMVSVDLIPIVRAAATLAAHQGGVQRVKFQVELPDCPVPINGASGLLQQVFVNLLLNALTAMPEGGLLRVAVEQEGDAARVRVSDTGHGMSAAEIERVFDPFYTTMPAGKGTGLGLSISYSIVRQHFGTIEIESVVGQGSTFTVRIPRLTREGADVERRS
jgi:PAS domain S-box-containing protein